jgi:hypothetical protein
MLPECEVTFLLFLVLDATEIADEGQLADGYILLVAGLQRARVLRDTGESWGVDLVLRYHRALDNYIAFYGVSME